MDTNTPAPTYSQPPLDPTFAALLEQTKQQDTEAVQQRLRGDSASLMARYGTMLSIANLGSSNAIAPIGVT